MVYACAAVIVAVLLYFVNKGHQNREERRPRARPVMVANDGPAGRRGGARRRGINARIQEQEARREELNQAESEGEEFDDGEDKKEKPKEKMGAKKLRKLQEKEQKKLQREAEERERAEKKKRQEEKDEEKKKKEEQEMLQQKLEEEQEERIRLEKERREMEEYLKLKEEFSIEEEGEQEGDVDESEIANLLQQFIDYVKQTKVIFLEDLASHFGLRVQDAIDRVQTLLQEGTLTGVIDDRGKFIYISMEELQGVADFVKQQGRVSIAELAKASNSLINLKPEEMLVLGEAS